MPECADCLLVMTSPDIPNRERKKLMKRGCKSKGCDNYRGAGQRLVRRNLKGVAGAGW